MDYNTNFSEVSNSIPADSMYSFWATVCSNVLIVTNFLNVITLGEKVHQSTVSSVRYASNRSDKELRQIENCNPYSHCDIEELAAGASSK